MGEKKTGLLGEMKAGKSESSVKTGTERSGECGGGGAEGEKDGV